MRTNRDRRALVCILLLVLMEAPTLASANHATGGAGVNVIEPGEVDTGIPTVDTARDDILAQQADAIRQLNAFLTAHGAPPESLVPDVPANVLTDHAHQGGRVGGLGPWRATPGSAWRVESGAGVNGTYWTMTDPATGKYATMDALLISPLLDLSAYPLQTGLLPYVNAGNGNGKTVRDAGLDACPPVVPGTAVQSGGVCMFVGQSTPNPVLVQDQINLILRHRYNFMQARDGAQVLVYERDPLEPGAQGFLVEPQRSLYAKNVVALHGPGYTDHQDWVTDSYDLTVWAGKRIYVAFRVATSPQASADPGYFSAGNFPAGPPYGWAIDDVQVVSPAWPNNVKVESITGPGFRATPQGYRVTPPGENVTLGAEVLNAAAVTRATRVVLRVEGADEPIEATFDKNLTPGEVWTPNLTLRAPDDGGFLRVYAVASNPGPENSTLLDPTLDDNDLNATFEVVAVPRLSATVRPSTTMLDDGAEVSARITVQNDGNVPLEVNLTLTEVVGPPSKSTYTVVSTRIVPVAVGANQTYSVPLAGLPRGEHRLLLNATAPGVPLQTIRAAYYVHAAPPPVFNATSWPPGEGWDAQVANRPLPVEDDWMWVGLAPRNLFVLPTSFPTLRATATAEALAAGGTFESLRLSVRYMAVNNPFDTTISLGMPRPVENVPSLDPFWSISLPRAPAGSPTGLAYNEAGLGWRTLDIPVDPQEANGYPGVWTNTFPELRIASGQTLNNDNTSLFFLDDLRLTGVPKGADESARVDIIRITGDEPSLTGVDGVTRVATAPVGGSTVTPQEPSVCSWATPGGGIAANCWIPMSKARIAPEVYANIHWDAQADNGGPITFPDGSPAVYAYRRNDIDFEPNGITKRGRAPERLLTPTFNFSEVIEPRLDLETLYAFPSRPHDDIAGGIAAAPKYDIFQVGIVELQYRRDDGTWSDFLRIVPEGGHHSILEQTPPPLETPRMPYDPSIGYRASDGLSHPAPCFQSTQDVCDAGGYHKNLGVDNNIHWADFGPYRQERLTFRLDTQQSLKGVNLSNREVRLAFHASTLNPGGAGICPFACDTQWLLRDIRVTPVSTFAVDGTVESVNLSLPYDWRALGIGPDTKAPVNVTVRNSGLYPERFELVLNTSLRNGESFPDRVVDVGQLEPNETRSLLVDWQVPAGEGRRYVINATLRPLGGADEKPFDDVASLGLDGSLVAQTLPDAGLTGAVHPTRGRETLARRVPILLHNRGNVPLDDVRVTLTIERLVVGGSVIDKQVTWTLKEPLPPNPAGVPLQQLVTDPEIRPDDLYYTPGIAGDYVATFRVARASGEDAQPNDNLATIRFAAGEPLFAEDFEEPVRWTRTGGDIWDEGPGFRSTRSLLAANRTTGALPVRADAWIVTPPVPLSNAMSAVVNAFVKYDLEKGYDGVRLEVSKDGQTWLPIEPTDDRGLRAAYPEKLVSSNPLSAGPLDQPGAYSGDSRGNVFSIDDGWVPVSFDLQDVPELREAVPFTDLRAPQLKPTESITRVASRTYLAPSMVVDPKDPEARWEIENLVEDEFGPTENFWWSGPGSKTAAPVVAKLQREFDVSNADATETLVLTWWDWRAGSHGDTYDGISGKYSVVLTQVDPDFNNVVDVAGELQVGEPIGRWFPMRIVVRPDEVNFTLPLHVEFRLDSAFARASDLGWAIDEVRLATERIENGILTNPHEYTKAAEKDADQWGVERWSQVSQIPARPITWGVSNGAGMDGLERPLWRADIDPFASGNTDSRLISPAVDLSEVGGSRVGLRVAHRYDLLSKDDDRLGTDMSLGQMKFYRGGAVEVQALNRTTGKWDPWRQLYAPGQTPVAGVAARPNPAAPAEGLPYPRTLVESGDTFERHLRRYDQSTQPSPSNPVFVYFREHTAAVSYAFSGQSNGYVENEFDLTPYAGQRVRFAFHVYAGAADVANAPRMWAIDSAQVVGYVLSSSDVQLRWRLGTDASIQPGSFAVDQLEVSGRRYERSIGIDLDPLSRTVQPGGNLVVRGNLTNYGMETRRLVAIGVRESRATPFRQVVPITAQPGGAAPEPYAAISGTFDLAPAGSPGSRAPFEFNVGVFDSAGATYNLTMDVLEARVDGTGFAYRAVKDDVPGRAHRAMDLTTVDRTEALVTELSFAPSTRASAGPVVLRGVGLNNGTREVELNLTANWTYANGTLFASVNRTFGKVQPGQSFTFELPAVNVPGIGNFTVNVTGPATPYNRTFYRVGRTDVNASASFDGPFEGWSGDPRYVLGTDDAAFGNASILFGYNTSAFVDERLSLMGASGSLFSAPMELVSTAKNRSVSFWYKPLMSAGSVQLSMEGLTEDGEPSPLCSGFAARNLYGFSGREDRWRFVRVQINETWNDGKCSLKDKPFRLRFDSFAVEGQGWRLDGVTVGSGALNVTQATDAYVITDSAQKEYPIVIRNPGHVPKDVELSVDPLLSRLSEAQRQWLSITPRALRVEPGATAVVMVRVDTPAARGAFAQTLDAVISATDLAAPYAPSSLRLTFDFRPLPRQDLNVAASIDGKPVGAGRADVEEAVPHEVSVVLTNQGAQDSGPTDVRLDVIDDATGRVLWTQTRAIPGLGPFTETEESFIVSGAWKPAFGARGNHTLHVVVDPDHRLVDYDRTNDDVRIPLAVVRLIRPDLAIDARDFGVTTPGGVAVYEAVPGQLVRVAAAVTNEGYADAHDVTLRLLAGSSVLKEEVVPVLHPGETHLVRANQFAPNASIVYRVLAFTPDLELLSENNERSVELPIFPAEVRVEADALDALDPGATRVVNLTVVDDGPYPLTLRLDARTDGPLGRLERAQVALAPGERATVPMRVTASADERAGVHLLVVRALDGDTVRAQRTVPLKVAERPAALLLPHLARGPPGDVLVQLDAVNTGNVALDGAVVVRALNGTELARAPLANLTQGRRDLVTLRAALPPDTAPGRVNATLAVVEDENTLASLPIDLDVLPWSELDVKTTPRADGAYDVHVEHHGNARATRDVVLLEVPPGVDARPSTARLDLEPGAAADFTVQVQPQSGAPSGLFKLHLALIDPAPADVAAEPRLAPITLDLRAADLDVGTVRRDEVDPGEGDLVTYRAVVRNDGAKDAKSVPVELYVDGLLVDRKEVASLPPGQSTTVDLAWKATSGAHGIVLAIDAHGPLGDDAPAYTERVQVASSLVPGASFMRDVPAPWGALVLVALVAVALGRRRTSWRR